MLSYRVGGEGALPVRFARRALWAGELSFGWIKRIRTMETWHCILLLVLFRDIQGANAVHEETKLFTIYPWQARERASFCHALLCSAHLSA